MPKQNQYKNMFKSTASSSLAPGQSSLSQPQTHSSSSSSQSKTSQHVPSSSSDGDSSQFIVPSTYDGVSSQPTKHKNNEDNHDWLVDVIGVMGQVATNALYFPISFKKWPDMPNSYLDRVFDEILMARFLFMIDHQRAKRWVGGNLSKKWKDHRHKLWHAAENPLLSKEEIIRKSPNGIPMDQWALFVNYRMDEKTQKLCKKNQHIRQNQIPHTGGAKSLARRRAEMIAKGEDVDRGKMWIETHKKKDGSYVTEAAREIGEKIEEIRSQKPESIVEVSPNDALGIVLGPEHPGSVRALGLGVVPTMAFKQTSRRFKHVNASSCSTSAPTPEWQQEMTSMKSQLNALLSLYQRNIGNIPEEFAQLFSPPPQAAVRGSGAHQSPIGPSIN